MPIEKLRPSFTFTEDRLKELEQMVPEAFADGKIDWETLQEALGEQLEDGREEHFGLTWPGKREARRLASIPSRGTLVPCPGEGINEDETENVFIEGENLEVLKLLQKSYAGKIKMIYIDPPYNTGNDFIYNDKYADPLEEYLKYTGAKGESGELLTTNTRSDGRFHSRWLNMMYPRLLLARQLLRDDGVIFVSIDDNEVYNLRIIMNEIFGEENFVAQLIWHSEGHTDNQYQIKITHEYILLYIKKFFSLDLGYIIDPNTRPESNLWKGYAENSITKNGPANPASEIVLPIGFPCKVDRLNLMKSTVDPSFFNEVNKLGYISRDLTIRYSMDYPIRLDDMVVNDACLQKPCKVFSGWANRNKLLVFIHNDCKPMSDEQGDTVEFYLSSLGVIYYKKTRSKARNIISVLQNMGTTERMRSELEEIGLDFDYPKPKELIEYLIKIGAYDDRSIIMDFFAGSGTVAQSVMNVNKEDHRKRSFILVQIPQPTIKKDKYKNIAELLKDRIRKNINSQLESHHSDLFNGSKDLHLGVKTFKLAKSNFKEWQNISNPEIEQIVTLFQSFTNPLVDDWKEVNILNELLLIEGFPLISMIAQINDVDTNKVYRVSAERFCDHELFICLDPQIYEQIIQLSMGNKDIFICLDSALTDELKARLEDQFNVHVI